MEISNTDLRFLNLAFKISRRSTHPDHQLGAVVVKGGAVIDVACNHSQWKKHAETRVCRRGQAELTGATLYVVRGNWRCSKPCEMCERFMRQAGIETVVYIDINSKPRKEYY